MKKLKDFLYDYNDILIALALLLLATAIILFCMNSIIEYPKTLISEEPPVSESPVVDDNLSGSTDENGDSQGQDNNNQASTGNGANNTSGEDNANNSSSQTKPSSSLWSNGVLAKDIQVHVSGNSAYAAIQCLVNAGLLEDYKEYQTICENQGLNHENVGAGFFTFAEGSTKADIVHKVNLS